MAVRFAQQEELGRVNDLRRQVNELHVSGRPDVFKAGFSRELQEFIQVIFNDPRREILVCEREGVLCGYAVLNHITKEENPFMLERDYLDIDEFGVDAAWRRQGVATEMIRFIADYAGSRGFDRVELNMWEFNREALEFYEAVGFRTYRRYMEMKL